MTHPLTRCGCPATPGSSTSQGQHCCIRMPRHCGHLRNTGSACKPWQTAPGGPEKSPAAGLRGLPPSSPPPRSAAAAAAWRPPAAVPACTAAARWAPQQTCAQCGWQAGQGETAGACTGGKAAAAAAGSPEHVGDKAGGGKPCGPASARRLHCPLSMWTVRWEGLPAAGRPQPPQAALLSKGVDPPRCQRHGFSCMEPQLLRHRRRRPASRRPHGAKADLRRRAPWPAVEQVTAREAGAASTMAVQGLRLRM